MGEGSAQEAGPVWLVGMMGAGKSTVGRQLAERLGRPFVDCDREIEARAGLSIPEIFEREGEAGFRARERAVVEELAGQAAVVALGGGALGQAAVRERVAARGRSVYLRARLDTLLERVGSGRGRPLLEGLSEAGRRERLSALLEERRAHYEGADAVVDGDGLAPAELADRVREALARVQEGPKDGVAATDRPNGGSAPPAARR